MSKTINISIKTNTINLDAIAEQWVNLMFTHLHYKKQNNAKANKNEYGK